jgi:hypothetical protein
MQFLPLTTLYLENAQSGCKINKNALIIGTVNCCIYDEFLLFCEYFVAKCLSAVHNALQGRNKRSSVGFSIIFVAIVEFIT